MPIIHWFRRDLRLHDNTALFHAASDATDGVIPVFIFDDAILKHPDCGGPIVQFMVGCLDVLAGQLRKIGGDLLLLQGKPIEQLQKLIRASNAKAIYFNKDYEPYAVERDMEVEQRLPAQGVVVKPFKDSVIFEEQEILSASKGEPYTVYSPYRNAWMKKLGENLPVVLPTPHLKFADANILGIQMPTPKSLGFEDTVGIEIEPGEIAGLRMLGTFCKTSIRDYPTTRNLPAEDGSSRLSPHLRHGTISPRQALAAAKEAKNAKKEGGPPIAAGADTWIGELVWREFYQQILFNFPKVVSHAFKEHLEKLPWEYDEKAWQAWVDGKTGFPIVDAGMRQLNQTGWMHNRVRMIVAMFLTKDQRIDYKRGERYFANRLIDFEIAQNNGNWQWCSSTGTDAQPYFRIFNPVSQSKTCDQKGEYIRRYVPELAKVPDRYIHEPNLMPLELQEKIGCRIGKEYPAPILDHAVERDKTLAMFKKRGN